MYFIRPPHLTNASALPGETGNPEIAFSAQLDCVECKMHQVHCLAERQNCYKRRNNNT